METLQNLESFVRSAEEGSFSAAGRRMSITAAAVSRNVAVLEQNLGVRLFQRSTRKLTLTEGGERLLKGVGGKLEELTLPIHDDVRFGAWAALGDFGRTGSFGFFHRVTTDTFANALEG